MKAPVAIPAVVAVMLFSSIAVAGTISVVPGATADNATSPTGSYTHLLDFNAGGTPDTSGDGGANFIDAGLTGPNWSLTFNSPGSLGAGSDLLDHGFYNQGNAGDQGTLLVSGLLPAVKYLWKGFNKLLNNRRRTQVTFTGGVGGPDSIVYDQLGTESLEYDYIATGTTLTITFDQMDPDSYVHYGFANEIVPEPSSWALFCLGAMCLGVLHRRRSKP